MSLRPEDNETNNYEQPTEKEELLEEESTVFSAPAAHREVKKGSRMLRNGILTTVLLVLIAGFAALIWVFVPKLEDDMVSSGAEIETKPLWTLNSAEYSSVTIKGEKGTIELYSVEKAPETSGSKAEIEWNIKGVDNSLISRDKTKSAITTLCTLEYLREMENKDADYGFGSPTYRIELKAKDESKSKILFIGSRTADGSAVYIKTSSSDTVYLAETDTFGSLSVNTLDYADTTGLPAFSKDASYNGEYFTDGALSSFDKIVIKGTSLSEELTFEKNKGVLDFGSYVITSPTHRYANTESVSGLYSVFTNGLAGVGVYSFDNSLSKQKLFGFLEPDFVATIYAGKESRTFKLKKQIDGYYALIGDGLRVILKVDASNLPFATYGVNNFYSNFMFIESLTEVNTIKIEQGNESHSFKVLTEVTTNAEGEKENRITAIKANGKEIDTKNFQNYYEHLLWITAVEFNFIDTSKQTADLTIHITHNDGTKDTVIKYYKKSDMRYQMEVNGERMGVISSSSFKNIFKYADNVANGKNYSS